MASPVRLSYLQHVQLLPKLAAGNLVGVLQHLHERYGPVVDFGYGSNRMVLVFGPEANEHVLSKAADTFEWGEAMQALVAVDGPTALVVSDGDDHRRRRRLVQPAFSIKRVDAHLGLVVTEVDRALAAWKPGAPVDASASLRDAVRRIVVRALFGEELGAEADRFGALLDPGLRYVQRMPQMRFEHDLKVTPFARVQRGNRAADELVLGEVARRRAAGIDADAHPDTLSALLAGVDGESLMDAELLDQVRSLMAAGFDTTAGAASWLVLELGRNPEAFAAVRAEVDAVLGDRAPTIDDLRALPLTLGAVQEVLRLWPPGPAAPRMSIAPSELHGMTIPAGRMVLYSAYVTGRMPELWPDPERFDPTRWAPGAPEPAPYSFVPFGGGSRRCIGFALATLELQVLAVRLAQQVEWRSTTSKVKPSGIATLTPKGGVPIEVITRC
ncbi:MAG: cytochrome P450 [Acidimicrobiales bacterium]